MKELQKDIKRRVEALYIIIQDAKDELENIRENQCTHIEVENGEDFKLGEAEVTACPFCGKILNSPESGFIVSTKTSIPEYLETTYSKYDNIPVCDNEKMMKALYKSDISYEEYSKFIDDNDNDKES